MNPYAHLNPVPGAVVNPHIMHLNVSNGNGIMYERNGIGPFFVYPAHFYWSQDEDDTVEINAGDGEHDWFFRTLCDGVMDGYDLDDADAVNQLNAQRQSLDLNVRGRAAICRRVMETGIPELMEVRVQIPFQNIPDRLFYVWVAR